MYKPERAIFLINSVPSQITGLVARAGQRGIGSFCHIAEPTHRFGLRFAPPTTFSRCRLVPFSPQNRPASPIHKWRKVRADAVRDPKHPFHCRVPQAALDQAQHGLGNARTLGNSVLGKLSAFALSPQKPNDLLSDGLVMSDTEHEEGSQQRMAGTYIAIVKYPAGSPGNETENIFLPN
jgi:hypothetical protein